jgi:serine/threonine protein kinase
MLEWEVNPGDIVIEEKIGSGNFGTVWIGRYQENRVAVKLLEVTKDMKIYYQREIDALQLLKDCPNIIQLIGIFQRQNELGIVTEYVNGGDLYDVIQDDTLYLSWGMKAKLALGTISDHFSNDTDIINAVEQYTDNNLMHRDLKMENILVYKDFTLKLWFDLFDVKIVIHCSDFGLCKPIPKSQEGRKATVCGTERYMAPEVLLEGEYTWKADIFSFGVVRI